MTKTAVSSDDHNDKPCPNCGYCPTCGRARQVAPYWNPQPYYTWWQTHPYTYTPTYTPTVVTYTGSATNIHAVS